jgi:LemA protein
MIHAGEMDIRLPDSFSALPWVLLALAVLLPSIWFMATYNSLVRLKQYVFESWSGIDTELKRRYDLIPNLVETIRGYAAHERATLEQVIQARAGAVASTGSPALQAKDENVLVGSLRHLLAVAENYPVLKANENFLSLQKELANTEDRIQAARRFYNANVRDLNTRVEVFPSNLIAGMFGFKHAEFFEIEEAVRIGPAPRANL